MGTASTESLEAAPDRHWIVGRYRLERVLGRGGDSVVYRAYDAERDGHVALKRWLVPNAVHHRRESSALHLRHPHIIRVLHTGRCQRGLPFLTMELLCGTLADHLSGVRLPVPTVVRIMGQVFDALRHAHERSLVHRDIKPSNLLLTGTSLERADLRVGDFGLAIAHGPGESWSSEPVAGTPRYMAPEQAVGEPVDARTDIYSAGVVLFEALTGRAPFEGDTPVQLLKAHVSQAPPSAREYRPDLPDALVEGLAWMLEKDPSVRCPSAAHGLAVLERAGLEPDPHLGSKTRREAVEALQLEPSGPPVELSFPFWGAKELSLPVLPDWPALPSELPTYMAEGSGPPEPGAPFTPDPLWRRYGVVAAEPPPTHPFFLWLDGRRLGPLSFEDFRQVWARERPVRGFASVDGERWVELEAVSALMDEAFPSVPPALAPPGWAEWFRALEGLRERSGLLHTWTGRAERPGCTTLYVRDGRVVHAASQTLGGTGVGAEDTAIWECLHTGQSLWQVQFADESLDPFVQRIRHRVNAMWEGELRGFRVEEGTDSHRYRGPTLAPAAWDWMVVAAASQPRFRSQLGPFLDHTAQTIPGHGASPELERALAPRLAALAELPLYRALAAGVEPGLVWALQMSGWLRF